MNNIGLAVSMATAPSTAFAELRERPRFWFPLLLLVIATLVVVYWYYSVVDIEWLKHAMYANDPTVQNLSEAERAKVMGMFSRNAMLISSVIGALLFLPVFLLLQAAYLLLAAKVTKVPVGFKHWFAFSCWTGLPMLLTAVVSVIFLLTSETPQMSPSVLQPLSINELIFQRPMGSPGYSLLESLSIPAALSWLLMIVGVHVWSQRSWLFSSIFILVPIFIIYGIWAAFAFR